MNLQFDESLAVDYKSASQKIRVMSESWLLRNLFCPCCGNEHVDKIQNNSPVADVYCSTCGETFELKSTKNRIGAKIPDGAYRTMIERITSNVNPQLFVMQYSPALFVTDLTFVPKFFFTMDIIERRKPLPPSSRPRTKFSVSRRTFTRAAAQNSTRLRAVTKRLPLSR